MTRQTVALVVLVVVCLLGAWAVAEWAQTRDRRPSAPTGLRIERTPP